MRQKTFILRSKVQRRITKEELESFDRKINKFHDRVTVKAAHPQLCVAFDHIFLMETCWYDSDEPEPEKPKKKKLPVLNGIKGEELGALWKWKRDGTLRGDLRGKQIDIDLEYFRDNSEVKKDKDGNEFYILDHEDQRLLIFPNLKKQKPNQPDFRIYEG